MKSRNFFQHLLSIAALAASGVLVGAQDMPTVPEPDASSPVAQPFDEDGHPVREIQMLPGDKRALVLQEEERNPYARRAPEVAVSENKENAEESEADRIRKVLSGLRVAGKTYGKRGIRLLAGDIILEAGRYLPKVLEDQTEVLKVENVTEETITIDWVDPQTGEPTGNRLPLKYNLETTVRQLLAGQSDTSGRKEGDLKFGVIRRQDPTPQMVNRAKSSKPGSASQVGGQLGEAEPEPETFEPGQ